MAKVTITLEDMPDGSVRSVMSPSGALIAKMIVSGEKTTKAHDFALAAINSVLREEKMSTRGRIIKPKLRLN